MLKDIATDIFLLKQYLIHHSGNSQEFAAMEIHKIFCTAAYLKSFGVDFPWTYTDYLMVILYNRVTRFTCTVKEQRHR